MSRYRTTLFSRIFITWSLIAFCSLGLHSACKEKQPPSKTHSQDIQIIQRASIPANPDDPVWQQVPTSQIELLLQDLVEPRQMTKTTTALHVQALSDGKELAVRLQWKDASKNDLPGAARFFDACAIQFPTNSESGTPDPQMGQAHRPVEITYWRADWQASVDGRKDSLQAIYPRATVDHYPYQAAPLQGNPAQQQAMALRYAPARKLQNHIGSGPRSQPVQELIASGPGTLQPATTSFSSGKGIWQNKQWSVVLKRPLPAKLAKHKHRDYIAFAIWDGQSREVGSRKMRTGWLSIILKVSP